MEQVDPHSRAPAMWVHPHHPYAPRVAPGPAADSADEYTRVVADLDCQFTGWGDPRRGCLVELIEVI